MTETREEVEARLAAEHLARQQTSYQPSRGMRAQPDRQVDKATSILGHLHPGEPYLVFRAQDILSSFALDTYLTLVEKFDPYGEQVESLTRVINEFRAWQQANPEKVKLPD